MASDIEHAASSYRVAALYRYPVKSLGGEALSAMTPAARGPVDDRRWMLTDAKGTFISQRKYPALAQYYARIRGNRLHIYRYRHDEEVFAISDARPENATGRLVTVWKDTFTAAGVIAPNIGPALGLPASTQFVYMNAGSHRPVDADYAPRPSAAVSFADGFPYLITTTASLGDLSRRIGIEVDMLRFRPNIVIATDEPFEEDSWTELHIGSHRFDLPKPCARCIMVTHEPDTGRREARVLAELARYRKVGNKVLFGQNGLWGGGAGGRPVRVGDTVTITNRKR